MNKRQAILLVFGFLLAPLVAAIVSTIVSLAIGNGANSMRDWLAAVSVVYLFSAPIIVVLGGASLALAHYLKMVKWWVAAATGLLCGALIRLIGHFDSLNAAWFQVYGFELLGFALIGTAPALFAWLCWHMAYARTPLRHGA